MAGAVNIRFGAIVTGFVAGVGQMGASIAQLGTQLNSNLSASYAAADRSQRVFDRGLGRLADNLKSTGASLSTYLTLPLAGLAGAGLKAAADMEQAGVSFRVLLKDANLAAQTVNDLKAFAASTPFEFKDVQEGAKGLLSYGFAVKDLKSLLTDAGNLASGFGVQIGEVTRVLGRIRAGDFGEAFERLRDFGIGRDVLEAKGLKFDKSGQYQGSVQQAMNVIQTVIRDRFGGQMEEQSKTIGGIFSNLKDQASFALTDIGSKLITVFNLKELGAGLVDTIGSLRDGFLGLPEPVQKSAVVASALLAVVGPLTVAIGGIIALVPAVIAGSAAITAALGISIGPILAIGAAVVAAAALIATNWSSIKATLTDSGIWDRVVGLATSGMNLVKSVISAAVALGSVLWSRFGGTLIDIAKTAFEAVAAVFRAGAGLVQGVFQVLTGILTLDWRTGLDGLVTIAKTVWNVLVDGFKLVAAVIGRTIAAIFRTFGGDTIADKVSSGIDSGLVKIDNLKGKIKDLGGASASVKPIAVATGATASTATTGLVGGLSTKNNVDPARQKEAKTALEETEAELAKLGKKIQDFNFRGITVPAEVIANYNSLKESVDRASSSLERLKPIDLGDKLKPIGVDPTKRLSSLSKAVSGVLAEQNGPALPGLAQFLDRVKVQFAESGREIGSAVDSLNNDLGYRLSQAFSGNSFGLGELAQILGNAQIDLSLKVDAFKNYLGIAKDQLQLAGVGLLENFGAAIGGGQNPLASILKTITNFIGDFAIKLGSAILLMGKLETVAAAIPGLGALFALTGPAKLIAGAGLVVGGAAIKAIGASAFAAGGLVSGPVLGLVGEGRGTSKRNPEVIAPLDKLRGMIGGGNAQVFIPQTTIVGSDLVIIYERAKQENAFYQ